MLTELPKLLSTLVQSPGDDSALDAVEKWAAARSGGDHSGEVDRLELAAADLSRSTRHSEAVRLLDVTVGLASGSKKADLYLAMGRLQEEALYEPKKAIASYRKATEAAPEHPVASETLARLEKMAAEWKRMVERLEEEAAGETEPALKSQLYLRIAGIVESFGGKQKDRASQVIGHLQNALRANPSNHAAVQLLIRVMERTKRLEDLAPQLVQLAGEAKLREEKVALLTEAAKIHARLDQADKAARLFQDVLEFVPGQPDALSYLVDYFTTLDDSERLVALYQDALRTRPRGESEVELLFQIGMVQWKKRGDIHAAEEYFRRIRKHSPAHPAALGFYRSFCKETGDNARLLQILLEAQRVAGSDEERIRFHKEIASLAEDRLKNDERAIEAFKGILKLQPDDAAAAADLKRLYRKTEKWNALVDVLKGELAAIPESDSGRRIEVLLEMVAIYSDHLRSDMMVIKTYFQILEIEPLHDSAFEALVGMFDGAKRWNDLIGLLGRRADAASDPAEKKRLFRRIADVWTKELNNFNNAVKPLEQLREIDPADPETVAQLKDIYARRRAFPQLHDLLVAELPALSGPRRIDQMTEIAQIAGERLDRREEALRLWWEIYEADPAREGVLDTIQKLAERSKDAQAQAEVVERRIAAESDVDARIALLLKAAVLYQEKLSDPVRASDAYRRVLAAQPGHPKATRMLKDAFLAAGDYKRLEDLYESLQDWEGLAEALGAAADKVSDTKIRIELSLKAARVYEERIGQPDRAFRAYERILDADPANRTAAKALASIYERQESWKALVNVLTVLAGLATGRDEKLDLSRRLMDLACDRIGDGAQAFEWAKKCYGLAPTDEDVVAALQLHAEDQKRFEDLQRLFEARLPDASGAERVTLLRCIADIQASRLGDVDAAVESYKRILRENPADVDVVASLETLLQSSGKLEVLVGLYRERIESAGDVQTRLAWMSKLARLLDEGLDRTDEAVATYRDVLDADPAAAAALDALERIYVAADDAPRLAEILIRKRGRAEPAARRGITLRLGRLYAGPLAKPAEAVAAFREVLVEEPGRAEAVEALEKYVEDAEHRREVATFLAPQYEQARDFRKLAWVLQIILEGTAAAPERLELCRRLARIREEALADPEAALETVGSAVSEFPDVEDLWVDLDRLAEAVGDHRSEAERLEAVFDAGRLTAQATLRLARRLAHLWEKVLGEAKRAERFHRRVFEADVDDADTFASLDAVLQGDERYEDLAALLRDRAERTSRVETRVEMLQQLAFLLEDLLDKPQDAVAVYREILEARPDYEGAIKALERLYEQAGRWDDLVGLLERTIGMVRTESEIDRRLRVAELREQKLDQKSAALDDYRGISGMRSDEPRVLAAFGRLLDVPGLRQEVADLLAPLHEKQGRYADLAKILLVKLEAASMPGDRVLVWTRIAQIREDALSDLDGAFEAYSQAVDADPSNADARRELARISDAQGLHALHADVLEEVLLKSGDDAPLRAEILSRLARLYDEALADVAKAEGAYRRWLEIDPDDASIAVPAAVALERILAVQERHADLVGVLRIQARFADRADDRVALLKRVAEIQEVFLSVPADALATIEEIDEIVPADLDNLRALERLYQQTSHWQKLIDALRRRSSIVADAAERRSISYRIAELFEEKLADRDEATVAYQGILAVMPSDVAAVKALIRLFTAAGQWSDLLDALRRQLDLASSDAERVDVLCRMGDVQRERLGDAPEAVESYRRAVEIDATHAPSREALEKLTTDPDVRLSAARILAGIFERESRWADLLGVLDVEIADAQDDARRTAALRRAAEVAEIGLSDSARAFRYLADALRRVAGTPEAAGVVAEVERLSRVVGDIAALTLLYREVVPDVADAALQTQLFLRVAAVAKEARDHRTAIEYYTKALDNDPSGRPALDALEEVYAATGKWTELLDIYRRKTDLAGSSAEKIALLFKQARLCEERLDDASTAMAVYESILHVDPRDREATAALERHYAAAERWGSLVELVEGQLEWPGADVLAIRHRLGEVILERLGDPVRAFDAFRTVLDADSRYAPTIERLEGLLRAGDNRLAAADVLEDVYRRQMELKKLVGVLEVKLEFAQDPESRKDLLRRIGQLYDEQLENMDQALASYGRLYREDVEDKASRELVERLANVMGAWDRLAELYDTVLRDADVDTATTAAVAYRLGEICEQRLGDLARARAAYRRAYSYDVTNVQAMEALERVFAATEDWDALLDLLRQVVDATYDPASRKRLLFQMAGIEEEKTESRSRAIDTYVEVLDVDPVDSRAIAALDRLYYYEKRWRDLADLVTRQIEQSPDDRSRNALRFRLGTIFQEQLADVERAVSTFEEILRTDPAYRPAMTALEGLMTDPEQRFRIAQSLEPVYRQLGEWKSLVGAYRAQLESLSDPTDRILRWLEIARLFEQEGKDPANAFAAYCEAFKEDPAGGDVLGQVQRLAAALDAWSELVPTLEAGIAKTDDTLLKSDLLRLAARTLDRRLGDFRGAVAAYERLLALEPADGEAVDGLDALLTLLADWERLIGVLDRKIEMTGDIGALVAIRKRQGEICEDQLGRVDAAIDFYRKALDLDESDLRLYDSITRLLERKERYGEIVEVLQRELTVLQDPEGRQECLLRAAAVLREKLADVPGAIRAYRALLEEFPSDVDALDALDALYVSEVAWHDLHDVLLRKLEVVGSDAERLALRLRLGGLAWKRLDDSAEAVDHFERALAIAPDNDEAASALREIAQKEEHRLKVFEVLEPVLRRRGAWAQLLDLRELRLAVLEDPVSRVEELGSIADLLERALERPAEAFEAHLRAVREEAPSNDAIAAAERLAGHLGRWADLAEALRVKARVTADAGAAGSLWRSVGAICEERLADLPGAVEGYRSALDAGADEAAALDALDRLYTRLSKWDDLTDVLERQMAAAVDPRVQSRIELRIGRIRLEKYEDLAGAIAAMRSVVDRTPDDAEATVLLESLVPRTEHLSTLLEILAPVYRSRGEHRKLLDLMELRVGRIESVDDRVATLREMATLAEDDLRDPASAFRCLSRAFEALPDEPGLLEDLERLGDVLGAFGTLVELASAASGKVDDRETRIGLLLRCAKWSVRLGDHVRAVDSYRAVLAVDPEHDESLRELEKALAHLGRHGELADVRERRAGLVYDVAEKKALYRSLASLCADRLGDRARAAGAYDRILEADESDVPALDSAVALREALEEWPTVVSLMRRRLLATPDVAEANELRRRMGSLCLGPLDDEKAGVEAYKEILECKPGDAGAIATLEGHYAKRERWDDLRDLLRDRLDRASGTPARIELLQRLSELAERNLDSPDESLDSAMQILDYDRRNVFGKSQVERLLTSLKRWDDLVMNFETWVRDAEGSDAAEEMRLLVKIGEIREREMEDPDGAVEYFEKVLAREPDHTLALGALARIHERKGDWPKCVEALERASRGGGSTAEVSDILLRLGKVKHEHIGDASGALYHYQQAVQSNPDNRAAVDAVVDLARSIEQWPVYGAYAEYAVRFIADEVKRAGALLGVAKIQADKLHDSAKAMQLLEAARALAPDNLDVLVAVADRYTADGRTDEAIPLLQKLIEQDASKSGKRRSKESAVYLQRLAAALEAKGDVPGALARLEEAAKIDVTNVAVAFALGRLFFQQKEVEKSMQKLRPLLLQKIDPSTGIDKAEVYLLLAKMHVDKGEKPKALTMLERGLQASPGHEGCKTLLGMLK